MIETNMLLPSLCSMFEIEQAQFVFKSMEVGNTPSIVYADNIAHPEAAMAWDKGHCFYYMGDVKNKAAYEAVMEYFKSNFLCDKKKRELGVVKLYYASADWENSLLEDLKQYNPILGGRSLYKHELQKVNTPTTKRANAIVRQIDNEIIGNSTLKNSGAMLEEINGMWGSTQSFLDKGFGYCALVVDSIACWCTAEYVSQDSCGIGIETVEEYQGEGLASLTAAKFLEKCIEEGITPFWDCWKRNAPSVKVAEKLGFEKLMDYQVLLLQFDE